MLPPISCPASPIFYPPLRHPNHWENAAEYMYLYAGSPTGLYILYAYAGDSRRQANPYVIWAQSNGEKK